MNNSIPLAYVLSSNDFFDKINNICTSAHHLTNIDEILTVSLRSTLALFRATRGSIFLLADQGNELELRSSFGMNMAEQKKLTKRMGEGIVGMVADSKKPILVEDIRSDKRFQNHKSNTQYKSHSFLCSPLMIKDHLIGVINLADRQDGSAFTSGDLELLDFVSNQIAVNFQHAHLNQKFKTTIEETQKLKKEFILQERLATLGKLAGGIAHEFNNPLDGVMRYTNLAIENLDENDVVIKEYLLEVRHGLIRMANIVKSLLACARNEQPSSQKIEINRSIENCLREQKARLLKKNISVEKHLQKDIPEVVDLGMDRIFSNLISNAVDAMDTNGKLIIKTSLDWGLLKISISDTGKGISKEIINKIFDPFFTTKKIDQGCGLGLTIVQEIVKYYNGEIAIESAVNKGTTFTVILPIER